MDKAFFQLPGDALGGVAISSVVQRLRMQRWNPLTALRGWAGTSSVTGYIELYLDPFGCFSSKAPGGYGLVVAIADSV